jgi:hypothetical protein
VAQTLSTDRPGFIEALEMIARDGVRAPSLKRISLKQNLVVLGMLALTCKSSGPSVCSRAKYSQLSSV